jgi:UDP:flavonoid glycosyltransferase YjiC (YdhE family)
MGGGFGHISRCLALSVELKQRGWQTAFVFEGQHVSRVEAAGNRVLRPRLPLTAIFRHLAKRLRREAQETPAYTIVSDMNYQIVRDGFHDPGVVFRWTEQQLKLVSQFQPDVLIGDTWPLTSIIGRRTGLPIVQIIKSVVHPACPRLNWWELAPTNLVSPDVQPVFNPALQSWGLPLIDRAEDLLTGDLLLVPSIPELDPLPRGLPNTYYVGPLTQTYHRTDGAVNWLDQLSTDRPLVYITVGGGATPVGGRQLLQMLYDALEELPIHVIVSTGARIQPSDLSTPPLNFSLRSWVPGSAVIARSNVVVFPGGYGTMMETVRFGVPSLIIPFHSEQEANGRRMEASGAGIVIRHSDGPYKPVRVRWHGGSFSFLIASRSTVDAFRLRRAVHHLLSEERFRTSAAWLQKQVCDYEGPARAADLIEVLIKQ